MQPQEEHIKGFSMGEQTSVFFFSRYFPLTMTKLENVFIENVFIFRNGIIVCKLSLIKTYLLAFHVLRKFRDSAPLILKGKYHENRMAFQNPKMINMNKVIAVDNGRPQV